MSDEKEKDIKKWIKITETALCTVSVLTCCFATIPAAETDSAENILPCRNIVLMRR